MKLEKKLLIRFIVCTVPVCNQVNSSKRCNSINTTRAIVLRRRLTLTDQCNRTGFPFHWLCNFVQYSNIMKLEYSSIHAPTLYLLRSKLKRFAKIAKLALS